jgi:hypothetical protein
MQASLSQVDIGYKVTFVFIPVLPFSDFNCGLEGGSLHLDMVCRCSLYEVVKCLSSGFRREVYENCAFLGYYAAISSNFLPMFGDNLSVPSLGVKNPN